MRERVGSIVSRKSRSVKGKVTWWARITYTDPVTGKRHDRQRRAESKSHAKDLVQDLIAEVNKTGGRSLAKEHMTDPRDCLLSRSSAKRKWLRRHGGHTETKRAVLPPSGIMVQTWRGIRAS
jgi:hypothetical protein